MTVDTLLVPLRELVRRKRIGHADATAIVDAVADDDLDAFSALWPFWEHAGQGEPPGRWTVWLMMAGRGYGKTRSGAGWLIERVLEAGAGTHVALVAPTAHAARTVMVEGPSGVLAASSEAERPVWEPSLGRLLWPSGAQGWVYSAESPDRLRGPQFHFAWCDEVAAWPKGETWMNLRMALRAGVRPRVVATTTPRNTAFMRALRAAPETVVTGGRTADNPLTSARFRKAIMAEYAGTRLGRQELDGELVEDVDGALWTRDMIEACRVREAPTLVRVVIGVDPPAGTGGDACGIVVCGLARDGVAYVIEDASVPAGGPALWARAVADAAARHRADCIVAEANNGGAMVGEVLYAADAGLPVKLVHASRGKAARAEPMQLRYARGLVKHAGVFPALEDELCGLTIGGGYEGPGRSPDRADACVWALTELTSGVKRVAPRVRVL